MAIGSRRRRGGDEYIFVDGQMMRSDEVLRIDVGSQESSVPGQQEAQEQRDLQNDVAGAFARSRASLRAMNEDDAFGLRRESTITPGLDDGSGPEGVPGRAEADGPGRAPGKRGRGRGRRGGPGGPEGARGGGGPEGRGPAEGPGGGGSDGAGPRGDGPGEGGPRGGRPDGDAPLGPSSRRVETGIDRYDNRLMYDDRRKTRRKCIAFGIALFIAVCISLCVSHGYYFRFYSPLDVLPCYGEWFRLQFIRFTDPTMFNSERLRTMQNMTMYTDVISQVPQVAKYMVCGVLLAVAGALYQNTFRNPIAAPSMLGVSNGVSFALLLMILIYGTEARAHQNMYYIFTYIGGAIVLLLVIFGGTWMSGKGRFNVVNMLLMGTIVSQLLGVIMTYVQSYVFTEDEWLEYYELQSATDMDSIWAAISIVACTLVVFVPVIVFRFQLNLVSFSDAETKLLGIDPSQLRAMALACGSLMVLTAQVNTGQVSMVSLIVPFIARAVFGAEFRKQLLGTSLIGALLLLVCGDLTSIIYFDEVPIDLGSIVTIVTLPLFVWMLALQQRAWE